jgi:hypothetical protein
LEPVVVERGGPHETLDRIGWVVGLPARVLTLNSKVNNHDVSPETIEKLTTYLEQNDLTDVLVSVNEYDPKGQWRRLRDNYRVDPFWRYSAGTLSWLGYSLFPNRVFGGDEYNPFTNTLILTSDVPARALAEAAYAKDVHGRKHPGAYATISDLPLFSLARQGRATSDVLAYARVQHDWEGEKQAYHVLYPHIGSTVFGPASHFVPVAGPFLSAGGALAGHATGRTVSAVLEPKPTATPSADPALPAADPASSTSSAAKEIAGNELQPATPQSLPGEEGVVQAGFQEVREPTLTAKPDKSRKPVPRDSSPGRPN